MKSFKFIGQTSGKYSFNYAVALCLTRSGITTSILPVRLLIMILHAEPSFFLLQLYVD